MKHLIKAVLVIGALSLSACTNADRFNTTDTVDLNAQNGLNAANDINQTGLGGANDPSSPQFFSQTIGDRVLFEVHADEQGTREYNLALGARRANSVREYLISKGLASSRIRTVSYGKERPIAVCSEEFCYAQNRRAVTIISIGQNS